MITTYYGNKAIRDMDAGDHPQYKKYDYAHAYINELDKKFAHTQAYRKELEKKYADAQAYIDELEKIEESR